MRSRRQACAVLAVAALCIAVGCSAGDSSRALDPPLPPAVPIAPTEPTSMLFVSPQGDDANPGTRSEPLRTIGAAAAAAAPGTAVVVAPGAYHGSVATRVSGTEDRRITFVSQTRWGARIIGAESERAAWHNTGDHVDVIGFDISGDDTNGLLNGGSYVRIIDNRVHGFTNGNCIYTAHPGYGMHDIDIIGNVAFGCGTSSLDHGIYVSHHRGLVANNMSYGHAGYGIHCWHNCNALSISNNLVFANDEGGIVVGQGDSPHFGEVAADDFVVSNNVVVGNSGIGIVEDGATGPNNRYVHNVVFNNSGGDVQLQTGVESGTIVADPAFVDYQPDGDGDYRAGPESPLVDAGTPAGAPSDAIDDTPRPQASGYDIGIYER